MIVATYNEIENLPSLVDAIFDAVPAADILVVDDASPDGTGKWVAKQKANEPRLNLLSRSGKLGLGSAMVDALRWALQRNYTFVANLDADFSHPPHSLPDVIAAARSDDSVDVSIASRYADGGGIEGWPRHRRVMSRMVNGFARLWFGLSPRDCSGSFRCYRVSALRKMGGEVSSKTAGGGANVSGCAGIECIVSRGYAFYEEILWRLRVSGARMVEVPYTFQDRTKGETKLNLTETLRSIGTLITLRWR